MLRVLVVGGGGREHALVWKLLQSSCVSEIFCAPGNAGIAQHASCVEIAPLDLESLLRFARAESIDFTVVGPEAPLVAGLADAFRNEGMRIFGPDQKAAALEGSKELAKNIMKKYGIPTAHYEVFDNYEDASRYIKEVEFPCVVKADGLAAGKGVTVAPDEETALEVLEEIMKKKIFGDAGNKVVIEECLEGEEISVLAFTDGKTILPMEACQDHKPVGDGDRGPNTGGMGAYSPVPFYTSQLKHTVEKQILEPVVKGLAEEGRPYRGVLYAGLMITSEGPKVLEFNVRFGDPETQPLLMRMETDLMELMLAVEEGRLAEQKIVWSPKASVCVVMASQGYPGPYEKGKVITGLESLPNKEVVVYHAGTRKTGEHFFTAGGRVLGVTARGYDLNEALKVAYHAVEKIEYENKYYRVDIGKKAIGIEI